VGTAAFGNVSSFSGHSQVSGGFQTSVCRPLLPVVWLSFEVTDEVFLGRLRIGTGKSKVVGEDLRGQ